MRICWRPRGIRLCVDTVICGTVGELVRVDVCLRGGGGGGEAGGMIYGRDGCASSYEGVERPTRHLPTSRRRGQHP